MTATVNDFLVLILPAFEAELRASPTPLLAAVRLGSIAERWVHDVADPTASPEELAAAFLAVMRDIRRHRHN